MHVEVATARPYRIDIRPGARDALPALVDGASRVAIIHAPTLGTVADSLAGVLGRSRAVTIPVPDAEEAKTAATLASCWEALAAAGFTRNDVVIGLGGGATTDLAGFVAATWLRGVGYVAVPTSVLGMVDAAVGGKTGINLAAGKNLVGAFYEPEAVLCDLDLLRCLPSAEVTSGLAEVIKCGFIADTEILQLVAESPAETTDVTSARFAELVARSVRVKAEVVSSDLLERTSTPGNLGREALNYGHTLGHAIEAREHYTWRHGPAIAVGMVWMAEVSRRLLGLDTAAVGLHRELLAAVGLPTAYDGDWAELRGLMSLDKKARGAALRLVGLTAPGAVELLVQPDECSLISAYRMLSYRETV